MSSSKPPLLADATRDLARFGAALRYDDIPADVIARIKLSLLDSLGCCLFGATLPWLRPTPNDKGIYGFLSQLTMTGPYINKTLFEQAKVPVPGPKKPS